MPNSFKNEKPVQLVGIYHLPPSELHKHTITALTDKFLEKYAEFGVKFNNMLVVGDFNIHVEDVKNGDAEQFIDMCKAIELDEHVKFVTHHQGHTLDLVLTELNSVIQVSNIKPGEYISDHCLVDFIINYEKEILEINSIEFKNLKKVDTDELCEKIDNFDNNLNYDTGNLLEFLTAYTMGMDKVIDNVIPTKKAKFTLGKYVYHGTIIF